MASISFDSNQVVNGTTGNDTLFGNNSGGNTNDIVYGHQGNDLIYAVNSLNNSTLYGGQGDDTVLANFNNVVYGNLGNDTLSIGNADTAYGGQGNDFISNVKTSGDILYGQLGDDSLFSNGTMNQVAYGGQGNDQVEQIDAATSVLYGNRGNDLLDDSFGSGFASVSNGGAEGTSVLYGGQGDDTLVAFAAGGDTMYGGTGLDIFVANDLLNSQFTANDMVTVGDFLSGNDRLSMSSIYGGTEHPFSFAAENDTGANNAADALTFADQFYNSDGHANHPTFLFVYGGSGAGYLFYNSDEASGSNKINFATDGFILLGDNSEASVSANDIVANNFAG